MNRSAAIRIICFLTMISMVAIVGAETDKKEEPEVTRKPLVIKTSIEGGRIIRGEDELYIEENANGQWIQRTSAMVLQEVMIGDHLKLKIGVGGQFWYSFPELDGMPQTLYTKFRAFIPTATGIYTFGPEMAPFSLQFGSFSVKYNKEAKNLGEYLLRSNCYPGIVQTGGWDMIGGDFFSDRHNEALIGPRYFAQGVQLTSHLLDSTLQQSVLLHMERDFPPMYDLSLSYIGAYQPIPFVDVGLGATLNHILPADGEKTTPENKSSRYKDDMWVDENYPVAPLGVTGEDSARYVDSMSQGIENYTFKGIKTMARITLDPKYFITWDGFGEEDLKVYAEASVLGIKDYPLFYDKILQRIPLMFGINLPTLKVLDVLAFEAEYYPLRYEESYYQVYQEQLPVWDMRGGHPDSLNSESYYSKLGTDPQYKTFAEQYESDDWKWSVYASKHFGNHFSLFGQIANDHIRPYTTDARPEFIPVTRGIKKLTPNYIFKGPWYFAMRLEIKV
ncbi:MAG: hypothetical protein GF401_12325 [Chitinivibrionales bacterium]|nr:hypothetical protein [Chitinivibrionales bacterium]